MTWPTFEMTGLGLDKVKFAQIKVEEDNNPAGQSNDASTSGKRACALAVYKNKVKDGKRAIVRLKLQKAGQLEAITGELLMLEARLVQEQKQITNQMIHRDTIIANQKQEIEKLRRENKRLITRLKKISESRSVEELKGNYSKTRSDGENRLKKAIINSRSPPKNGLNNTDVTTLTSQFYDIHCSSSLTSSGDGRILHKPPIAEKPKFATTRILLRSKASEDGHIGQDCSNTRCNIVSTISRLLEEESDQGVTVSSGSSEPSSPESTLKPSTPRVIKIARKFESGFYSDDQKQHEENHTALVLDEYEVTSGYNSESVSEQEHEYENILMPKLDPENDKGTDLAEEEEEDNYVTFYNGDSTLIEEESHVYSNIEYFGSPPATNRNNCASSNGLLESNLDSSDTASETTLLDSPKSDKNIPRSRENINQIIDSESGNQIMQNFVEFNLDSLDLDDYDGGQLITKDDYLTSDVRRCGDGAEDQPVEESVTSERGSTQVVLLPSVSISQGGYEKFLEATGLSQKSILTPTRMFSNHRSVLKPRDIKHRDKLRSVFITQTVPEETGMQVPTSQRYWREPYL